MLFAPGYLPVGYLPVGYFAPGGAGPVEPDGPTTLREAVYSLLDGISGLTDIVGDRISAGSSPAGAEYPRVTFFVAARTGVRDLDGPTGTSNARVRVSAWSTSGEEAETMADLIREGLDGFSGTVGTVVVRFIDWLSEQDIPEPATGGSDETIHQILNEFQVTHQIR